MAKSVSISAIEQDRITGFVIKTRAAGTMFEVINQEPGPHGFSKFQMPSRNRRKKFGRLNRCPRDKGVDLIQPARNGSGNR